MVRLTSYIRVVGRHRSSDIWVATATEAGPRCDVLVETIDRWLPILSKQLWYSRKTYLILIHGVPTSFDTLCDSEDVNHHLLALNTDIILCPSALQGIKFLHGNCGRIPRKTHRSLILFLDDPATANNCISCQIALHGGLLPVTKFTQPPPRCFNCQHTGHYAHSCRAKTKCGLCVEDHDTRQCGNSQKDGHDGQSAPLKCAVCGGPYAASDTSCPARRAVIDKYKAVITGEGPYYPVH